MYHLDTYLQKNIILSVYLYLQMGHDLRIILRFVYMYLRIKIIIHSLKINGN